jgi:hypothetical protein
MSTVVVDTTTTKKVSKVVVEQVKDLTNIRSEVKVLEGKAKRIITALEGEFGKDDVAKTSDFDTLIHHNIEVARLDWRERTNFNLDTFKVALAELVMETHPELAEVLEVLVAEAVAKAQSVTKFTALTTLYK